MNSYRDSIFALSYYALEKALPVNYLLSGNPYYTRFLVMDGSKAIEPQKTASTMKSLGLLESVEIVLAEVSPDEGERAWTEQKDGLAYETFIHPLIIAYKFCAQANFDWRDMEYDVVRGRAESAIHADCFVETFLKINGEINRGSADGSDSVQVSVTTAKYAREKSRKGRAVFEQGQINFCFDKMIATVVNGEGQQLLTIQVAEDFREKYRVQSDLVRMFFKMGWADLRFDDFDDQIEVLDWLAAQNLNGDIHFAYGPTAGYEEYDAALPQFE